MISKKYSNLPNFIFSVLAIFNAILFLFVLPSFFYQFFGDKLSRKETFTFFFTILLLIVYSVFSFQAYYKGIDLQDLEGRPTRYGPMSGGDKVFFSLFSKPIAYLLQLFLIFLQAAFLNAIYFD